MSLRKRLLQNQVLVAPGIYDPLTAALATEAGFEALYLSGAAIAYTRLGRPDIMIVVGGVIPPGDIAELHEAGASAVFGPGTVIADAALDLLGDLSATLQH